MRPGSRAARRGRSLSRVAEMLWWGPTSRHLAWEGPRAAPSLRRATRTPRACGGTWPVPRARALRPRRRTPPPTHPRLPAAKRVPQARAKPRTNRTPAHLAHHTPGTATGTAPEPASIARNDAMTRVRHLRAAPAPLTFEDCQRDRRRRRRGSRWPQGPSGPAPKAPRAGEVSGSATKRAALSSDSGRACRGLPQGCLGTPPGRRAASSASRRAFRGAAARLPRRGAWAACTPSSRRGRCG